MEVIRVPQKLAEQMLAHAQSALPMEAVGMIGGTDVNTARIAIPLKNLGGPRVFLADPFSQFQAENKLREEGLVLLALYHSHPGGGTQLSEADCAFAKQWSCVHVVIALDRPHRAEPEIRAYRFRSGHPVEVKLHISSS